jgi:uncharacterized membrane protein
VRIWLNSQAERLRASLFFLPMVSVVVAIGLGQLGLVLDAHLDEGAAGLPLVLTSTVDSARAVLSTVAAATIGFAGVAFSVSLLTIQMGSSQYSPRVLHTLFRDPFNRRVMSVVVGTFTFCLIVLRSVRAPVEEGGSPVIPNLSVAVAVLAGVAAILAIVAFINHSAHSMDISEILERVADEAVDQLRAEWTLQPDEVPSRQQVRHVELDGPAEAVRFDRTGWVQQVDTEVLLGCTPPGGMLVLHVAPGRYAIADTPVCTITPPPDDVDGVTRRVRSAIGLGPTRTMQQDPSYGLRLLVDVALKALSPGINDPTTAQDAIFHAAAVLGQLLHRDPPADRLERDGRSVILQQQATHADLVELTYGEVRRAAASQPAVCVYVLESMELLHESLADAGLTDRLPLLERQARLVLESCEAADMIGADRDRVRVAYAKRFGGLP